MANPEREAGQKHTCAKKIGKEDKMTAAMGLDWGNGERENWRKREQNSLSLSKSREGYQKIIMNTKIISGVPMSDDLKKRNTHMPRGGQVFVAEHRERTNAKNESRDRGECVTNVSLKGLTGCCTFHSNGHTYA